MKPFQSFRLNTRLLFWDDRWLYLEQTITTADGTIACTALVKTVFIHSGARVSPAETVAAAGFTAPSPSAPAWVALWSAVEESAWGISRT